MNENEFQAVLSNRLKRISEILTAKSEEYTKCKDRLHVFKRAGELSGVSPEKALKGMVLKQLISVFDIIDEIETRTPSLSVIDEKIGDVVNYFILLEALLVERVGDKAESNSARHEFLVEMAKSLDKSCPACNSPLKSNHTFPVYECGSSNLNKLNQSAKCKADSKKPFCPKCHSLNCTVQYTTEYQTTKLICNDCNHDWFE